MSITKRFYGKTPDGIDVDIFTLSNASGMTAEITNYGGIVVSLLVPDRNGKLEDITLGFDKLDDYLRKGPYFGAIIGRVANRIENSVFEINGVEYHVAKNEGENHLHGGIKGFDKVLWQAEIIKIDQSEALQLTYRSEDGEENYPGNLDVKVVYTLTDDNSLKINYFAVSDKDTAINLTNHAYFNLAGHAVGNILNHSLMINADKFTPTDAKSIPTGEIREVKGTPMDFTRATLIGARISNEDEQIAYGGGYDHNWVLNASGKGLEKAAIVFHEDSGRVLEVYTTKPGIQFYSGNYLNNSVVGKGGIPYEKWSGLCLETQFYPNAFKHKHFPSALLKAGEKYKHSTVYKFTTR